LPVTYGLMIAFALISFIALLASLAMIPWGRLRFWWLIPMLLPVLYVTILIPMGLGEARRFAFVFLGALSALAAMEILIPKSSDELQPLHDETEINGNPWRWFG